MKLRKKGLLAALVIVLLLISSVYIFIPFEFNVSATQIVKCNVNAAFRNAGDKGSWEKWWSTTGDKDFSYHIDAKNYPNVEVSLQAGNRVIPGTITALVAGLDDSTLILWKCRLQGGATPWGRIIAYRMALAVQKRMRSALASLGAYLGEPGNAYGIELHGAMLRDSVLMVIEEETVSYPSTEEIYRWVHSIREFVASRGAKETNFPMFHVSRLAQDKYMNMVAIPIDRRIKPEKPIFFRHFVPWKALAGEVHGGAFRAEQAMNQLELYVADYHLTAMAMSFQSLVTERDREPDSSRWVTRVIVPVP
jgi:hypothetical protein